MLDNLNYSHYSGNMEINSALSCFKALSQDTRLRFFCRLVKCGPEVPTAGPISQALSRPPSTLSFHRRSLGDAQLVTSKKAGRSLIYAANFAQMQALVVLQVENCCSGQQ